MWRHELKKFQKVEEIGTIYTKTEIYFAKRK